MTKTKFVFNIDGKKVEKEPKEALKIYKRDYKEGKELCSKISSDLIVALDLLRNLEVLMEEAKKAMKKPVKTEKKPAVVSKKGTKPSKIEKPAKKAVKANPVKKIKKEIKSKRKAK